MGDYDEADFSDFFSQMFGQRAGAERGFGAGDLRGQDQHASIELDLQDSYRGAQRSLHLRVSALDGQGQPTTRDKELQVTIPPGVREGQMIRLAGQGSPGLGKGPAGDLLLEVHFRADTHRWAEGKNVYERLPLAPWEAALGGPIQVSTLAGELEVNVPAGYTPGRKLRVKGKGLPAGTGAGAVAGDLYLVLDIVVPAAQTDQQRQAYQALAQAFSGFQARGDRP